MLNEWKVRSADVCGQTMYEVYRKRSPYGQEEPSNTEAIGIWPGKEDAERMAKMLNRWKEENKTEQEKIFDRVTEISKELRELSLQCGQEIRIMTILSENELRKGQAATEAWFGKEYRYDHFFDGREQLTTRHKTVKPEEMQLKNQKAAGH